ncbi:MAG: hypothetical protein EP330_12840 [Deltaproteobacteria bacterium]|nr:MAG: hypothetical protein EP330_12840 [Deltaproteobacteria bacterium]
MAGGLVVCLLAIDVARRAGGVAASPPLDLAPGAELAVLALLAALYAVGQKVADLTQEHGLAPRPWLHLGYGLTAVCFALLIPFTAGATMLVVQSAFHGVIKGKVDAPAHFVAGLVICPLAIAVFAAFPGARVDWLAAGLLLAGSVAWMWANNARLGLGDHLFHQVRGDSILLLAVCTAIDAPRFAPILVVVAVEHLAYAATKNLAMRFAWYTDGAELVPEDGDRLGLAFHRH